MRGVLSTTSLVTIYKASVKPYFAICSPPWDTCGKVQKDTLQKPQSTTTRVQTGANYVMLSRYFQWPLLIQGT